jgi:hypothetical protein
MSLNELRREIRKLGFTVKTQMLSWGRHATFVHIESKKELAFNVASEETWKLWQPLLDYLADRENASRIDTISATEGYKLYGLTVGRSTDDVQVI